MRKMKLSEIKIFPAFAETTPSEKKMEECRYNWQCYGKQDRYIVVDEEGYLIDGYIQYLILKEHKEEYAQVKISNRRKKRWYRKNTTDWNVPRYKNSPTTYIYGVHPNSNCTKEFVWRVPESWGGFGKNIQIGDTVFCATKFGYSPVVVTKVEMLDKPPVDTPIKKVCKREIRRNGIVIELMSEIKFPLHVVNEDGTDLGFEFPENPLKEKWDKLYPPIPMPQYSQVCDGYSCMWCGRCPKGNNWKVPEEDKEVWNEYQRKVAEYHNIHNPSLVPNIEEYLKIAIDC